jgi:hypothetical protein
MSWLDVFRFLNSPAGAMFVNAIQNEDTARRQEQVREEALADRGAHIDIYDELGENLGFGDPTRPPPLPGEPWQRRAGSVTWGRGAPEPTGIPALSQEMQGYWDALPGNIASEWQRMQAPIVAGYGQREADWTQQARGLFDTTTQGYWDRKDEVLGTLEGAGTQARRDIDEYWRQAGAAGSANLTAQGFGGSTVGATMQMGYDRARQADIGRLDESLRQQQAYLGAGLSGEALAAQREMDNAYLNFGAALSGDTLGAQMGLGPAGFGYGYDATMANLGAQGQWGLLPYDVQIELAKLQTEPYAMTNRSPVQQPNPVNTS